MPIKSLEELIKIRENAQKKVNLREGTDHTEAITELMVGMATCGIAAGARETLRALLDEIEAQSLENIRVVQVGCLGYCHSEPIVQVNRPGEEPILYGKVDAERAKEIIQKHIMKNEFIDNAILMNTFNKA
ncbi:MULTISPECIES: (2Fe-2S) ferredoxin domain-containing protein [Anoxynatronum]|uniref:NAD(P)-dependent iron-only hydrogenase iron-sulfur protein n=2 Tax=Anoxynatronum TaxID=210622 RepID=A0AA45WT20_9CLOT|nr:(2Fe-2S) ferredoxin domain-containing protein [Anoxynatronum buryatiense]SMP39957.1 NAD(P)-dependent iron-only hydrogenase iron-sulfur protein [Anoxynatronum buryatiense]